MIVLVNLYERKWGLGLSHNFRLIKLTEPKIQLFKDEKTMGNYLDEEFPNMLIHKKLDGGSYGYACSFGEYTGALVCLAKEFQTTKEKELV